MGNPSITVAHPPSPPIDISISGPVDTNMSRSQTSMYTLPPSRFTRLALSRDNLVSIQALAIPSILSNIQGVILEINQQALDLLKYQANSLIGRNISILMQKKDRSAHQQMLAIFAKRHGKVQEVCPVFDMNHKRSIIVRRQDASLFRAQIGITLSPSITGPLLVANIISLEEQDHHSRIEETATNMILHDIVGPSTVLAQSIEEMKLQFTAAGLTLDNLLLVELCNRVILSITEENLIFAKLFQKQEIPLSRGSLEELFDDTFQVCDYLARFKEKSLLITKTNLNESYVKIAAQGMNSILRNLIGNAIKYSFAGNKEPIRCDLQIQSVINPHGLLQQVLYFSVKNKGEGFTEAEKEKLFNPYSQASRHEGIFRASVGLGLYKCRLLIQAMGGVLDARCTPGKEAEFYGYIPFETVDLINSDEDKDQEIKINLVNTPLPISFIDNLPPIVPRILYVEDTPIQQKQTLRLLKTWGYDVQTAVNISEALAIFKEEAFDLVLTDHDLGEGFPNGGLDLAQTLRAPPFNFTKAILILSGTVNEEIETQAKERGVTECIVKGNPQKLQALIQERVSNREEFLLF